MNAFELISMSRALDLGNLFEEEEVSVCVSQTNKLFLATLLLKIIINLQGYKRETRFAATGAANELVQKIEEASKPLGFDIQKKNYKVKPIVY